VPSARNSGSFMVFVEGATQDGKAGSGGTPGLVKKAVPTSLRIHDGAEHRPASSSLRASSTAVGMSGSSGCRCKANCTMMLTVLSRSQSGLATFTADQAVE